MFGVCLLGKLQNYSHLQSTNLHHVGQEQFCCATYFTYASCTHTYTFTHNCTARVSGHNKNSPCLVPPDEQLSLMMLLQQSETFQEAMYLRFVHHVCVSDLTEIQWATEPSLFNSEHTLKLQHNLESYIQMISCWLAILASRQLGNAISHFKGSLKHSSAWNRS